MHKIKNMLFDELRKYEQKGELSAGSLDVIHKLTDTIKNIDKIEMLEGEEGRSGRDMRIYDDDGGSYARRGMHYVRGHYSRDEGKDHIMRKLGAMMEDADDEQREIIRQCMNRLESTSK